jgi:ribonuclease-3
MTKPVLSPAGVARFSPSATTEARLVTEAEALEKAQQIVGYTFRDKALLTTALTHSSLADHRLNSNERLEFLGDAVLGVIICQELYQRFPYLLEGELTKIKSAVVSRMTCAAASHKLNLVECLFLGKGMSQRAGLPDSLAAAVFEAMVASMYLDSGDLQMVRDFVLTVMNPYIEEAAQSDHQRNFKSQLQQHAQQYMGATPVYDLLDEQGPDHHKCFEVCVVINGRRFDSAWGPSKKCAEQKAAYNAAVELNLVKPGELEEAPPESAESVPRR